MLVQAKDKSKTDWKKYSTSLKRKNWTACLIVLGTFVLFHEPVTKLFNTLFVQPFLKSCPKDLSADAIALGMGIWAIVYLYLQYYRRLKITISSIAVGVTILIIYFSYFRYNPFFDFYHLSFWPTIAYWDVILISIIILTARYQSFLEPMKAALASKLSLIEDSPLPKNDDDIYEREAYAKHICHHILATVPTDAFAIGVIGDWGSGKTQFLLKMKSILKEDKDTIVVDFNPWRAGKPDAIIEDFFKTLSEKLKPYNRSVDQKIREYSKKILLVGKEIQYRMIDSLIGEWIGETSVQQQYDQLNDSIKAIGRRIVILIDDVDRLTGKEVMEVLRLIRNTANFANTFFVVGLDQRYIISVLRNTKDFANEEEYLEKVFQLTITLPAFKKEVLAAAVAKYLITDDVPAQRKIQITEAIKKITKDFDDISVPFYPAAGHDNVFEKLVDNVRDLKRFANSFKIAANLIDDEVDIHDLMVLELIRNKNISLYNKLRDRTMLSFDQNRSADLIVNLEQWQKFRSNEGKEYSSQKLDALKAGLDYLVQDIGYKSSRKFQNVHNFYLYFSYQLFDLISLKAFNEARKKSADEMVVQYNQWIDENKQRELLAISTRITDFNDADELMKMLEVYANVKGNHNEWLILMVRLLFEFRRFNEKKYFGENQDEHKAFLKKVFANKKIKLLDRAQIASHFVKAYINKEGNETSLVFSQEEWHKILLDLLDQYLTDLNSFDGYALPLLGLNIQARDQNDRPVIFTEAAVRFQKALLENDNLFAGYIKVVLRNKLGITINNETNVSFYLFEGYLSQIFPDLNVFKKRLVETELDDPDYQSSKRVILKYFDAYHSSGGQAFTINSKEDRDVINALLKKYQNYMEVDDAAKDREDSIDL